MAHIVHSILTLACALVVYYTLPLTRPHDPPEVVSGALFLAGVAGLVWLTAHEVRRFSARLGEARTRVFGLLSVLYVVVTFFALTYYLMERNDPAQFDGLETRTDALYFSIVTLGTVGYGDVHAAGQEARIAAMVQIVFDLVVIGALFAVASSQIAYRMNVVRSGHEHARPERPQPPEITPRG
ncbi:potassium channel family protein [Jiangella rhizosphaerae]|uniref:Two pore domain potassium channel family protein n=1 Tax=Jiangella rhizosphaerae TaxID=2293569 RepID=A0A418KR83_9ACTN|nr:potassium channel family protein [Jiangella rhizosphaerae]RIQ24451.1 two pore domain potassium channel family protein [Jiangella rhizosphaerae]